MKLPPKQWRFSSDDDFTQIVRAAATLVNTWRTCSDERALEAMATAVQVLERELDAVRAGTVEAD